jgi:hypothetical protein
MESKNLTPRLYFSYGQFMIYDKSIEFPGCSWTEQHASQGFARRSSSVCFSSILEFGEAEVTIFLRKYHPKKEYERAISVPFLVIDGAVLVDGPEEIGINRSFYLGPGNYQLTVAQFCINENTEIIDIFFEYKDRPIENSLILIADNQLSPVFPLLEIAEVAEL